MLRRQEIALRFLFFFPNRLLRLFLLLQTGQSVYKKRPIGLFTEIRLNRKQNLISTNFQVHRQTWATSRIPPRVLNQTVIYDPAGKRAAGFVLHAIITFIIHRNPIRSCFPANFHNRGAEKQHSPTPGLGSGSGTPSPLALTRTANGRRAAGEREVPRGWETYGPAWCYVTPQPLTICPEAQVCRARQPLAKSDTTGALSFMAF